MLLDRAMYIQQISFAQNLRLLFTFNTNYHPKIYTVEAPDALEPAGQGASVAFRYAETNASAGVLFKGNYKSLVLGFPFETIMERENRIQFMQQIIRFFEL